MTVVPPVASHAASTGATSPAVCPRPLLCSVFPQPNVHVMDRQEICQDLGVKLNEGDKAGTLSNICRKLQEEEVRTESS